MGDLNCSNIEWTDMTAPEVSVDDDLLENLDDSCMFQLVFSPPLYRINCEPSLLNLIMVKYPDNVNNLHYAPPVGKADHVCLVFNCTLHFKEEAINVTQKRMPKTLSPIAIQEAARICNWPLPETTSPEASWNYIMKKILFLSDNFAPLILSSTARKPYITRRVKRTIERK